MSINNVKQFQRHVLQDFALQDELKEATDAEHFAELAVKLGKKTGYAFTVEEVKAVSTAQPKRQLNQVTVFYDIPPTLPDDAWAPLALGRALPV